MALAAGAQEESTLREAGFSDGEIGQWRSQTAQHLSDAGFSGTEVNQYFGAPPEPDMGSMKKFVKANLDAWHAPMVAPDDKDQAGQVPGPTADPKPAKTFLEALEAGLQFSSTGLIARGKMPDTVVPEHAPMAMRIAQLSGQLAGDLPAMVAGGLIGQYGGTVAGGAAGSALPGVGNEAGALIGGEVGKNAGAWALPAALRTAYVQHLQKGDIQDFSDFWSRTSAIFWDSMKAGTTGALTYGVGSVAGKLLGSASLAVPATIQTGGKLTAELATMTTVGKAMEGQVPSPEDFLDGAVLLAGLHLGTHLATELPGAAKNIQAKLQDIYAATGLKPEQVATEAATNPVLKQEILSKDPGVPPSLKPLGEPPQPGQEVFGSNPEFKPVTPEQQGEPHPTLGEGFAADSKISVAPSAEEQIQARIGEKGEKPALTFDKAYTNIFDHLNPVGKLVDRLADGEKLSVEEDPFALFRLAGAADGKTDAAIRFGPRDIEGKPTGTPALKEIFKSAGGDTDGLINYAIASRALELEGQGKPTGIPLEAAKTFVEENRGRFEQPFRQLVQFQDDGLRYLRDSGVLSDELYRKSLSDNQSYIPFNRVDAEGKSSGGISSTMPIKQIFGSELKLRNPLESLIRNAFAYTRIADENRAKLSLVDLANKTEIGKELVSKVAAPQRPIQVSEEEVSQFMKKNGIEGDPEAFTIFRPFSKTLDSDQIAVMRDGKREVYQVGDDVAKAIDADPWNPPQILRWASLPTKILRVGAVDTLDFLARHATRDMTNSFVYSKNGASPLSWLVGLKEFFTEGKTYQDWLASGGAMANATELDRDYIQKDIYSLSQKTGLIDKTMNLVKNPLELFKAGLDLMHYLAEGVVSSPRIGEFGLAKESGKSDVEAAYDSRNVTIDNQRMGAATSIRVISMLHAFWNTRIQGMDRMKQAFQEDPQGTLTKYALSTTLPALTLWWMNKDDPRYKDAPQWEKDLFYFVPTPWAMLRVPKAFEGGLLFGSLPERVMDGLYNKNPDAFKGFGRAVFEAAVPNPFMVDAARPIAEQFGNRSLLSGGNLVPESLKGVAPEYQYNPYTSETAKILGRMVGMVPGARDIGEGNVTLASPIILQNYIRAWSGGMGMYALDLADKALDAAGVTLPKVMPTSTLADIPFVKAFVVRYPSAGAQSIQDFYDGFQKAQTNLATIQHLAKSGDLEAATKYMQSSDVQEHLLSLQGVAQALGAQNRMVGAVYANPEIKPDEKRQMIDGLYLQMTEMAKQGNAAMKSMEKK